MSKTKSKNWLDNKVFAQLGAMFFITQTLGLYVATVLLIAGIEAKAFTDDINDPINAFFLIIEILIFTGILLLVLKYKKRGNFLWVIEGFAVFLTSFIVFSVLFWNDYLGLAAAVLILYYRYTHKKSVWFRNFVSIITIAGAGGLIGLALGIVPVLLFIILLSIYDLIAVFGTKHMVTIGKAVTKKNLAFTVSLPSKKHTFELGNGDLIIPLITAVSVYANGMFINNGLVAALVLGASFIGLVISIYLVGVKKFAMPALPPQTVLMLITIGLAILLGL
ncbi:MAG: hypothetical protein HON47_00610 [Candidatus Diapherotrites archaeon]|jgi:presenilin-like A22 family membrane protease|uniref:Uncharacterized protein n=1 Tax=Candidatus Iainarchaeum sp. TaxID=3101447 RepID=A0A8T5GDM4_9ARCH|nr:hypothetical protein [Candidatus Diapherotrites archaeon]MBT7240929.1 hypothetical protein [Candidatus Diapherotrites archaeon]